MTLLERLKLELNITYDSADVYIQSVIDLITNKLKYKYSWDTVPEEYEYLILDYVGAILLAKFKLSLEYDDTTVDKNLLNYLDDVEREFLRYMHLKIMPEGLRTAITNGLLVLNKDGQIGAKSTGDTSGEVTSIKEGDTTVQFKKRNSEGVSLSISDLMSDSIESLKEKRVIAW